MGFRDGAQPHRPVTKLHSRSPVQTSSSEHRATHARGRPDPVETQSYPSRQGSVSSHVGMHAPAPLMKPHETQVVPISQPLPDARSQNVVQRPPGVPHVGSSRQ